MSGPVRILAFVFAVAAPDALKGQAHTTHDPTTHDHSAPPATDSAYHAVQTRGRIAMGVDQYSSTHRFDALADGGRIELQRDSADAAGAAAIRDHLRWIAERFAAGDFATPGFVHDTSAVPGTVVMAERRALIQYAVNELPQGGEIRITARDPAALEAIHEFIAFQRSDHRAGGHGR